MKTAIQKLTRLTMAGAVVIGLAACSNDAPGVDEGAGYAPDTGAPLVFTSGVTRGTVNLNNENIKYRHFCVSAFYSGHESFFSTSNDKKKTYFKDIEFMDEPDGKWHGTPKVYWPLDPESRLSFFAYAPAGCGDQVVVNEIGDNGWPSITVTPMENVTNQPDFCVATPLIDKKRDESLPLEFNHMLTKVVFAARYEGDLPGENFGVRVDNVTIRNVVGTNTLRFSQTSDNNQVCDWDAIGSSSPKSSYILTYGGDNQLVNSVEEEYQLPKVSADTDTYKVIQFINGYLYLIPQSLPDDAELEITYSIYELFSNAEEAKRTSVTSKVSLKNTSWPKGYSVTYNFTLFVGASKKIVFEEPVIEEWVEATTKDGGTIE